MSPPPLPGAGAPGPATAVRPTCHRSCLRSRAPAPGRASATHLAGARPTPSGGGGGGGGGVARRALPPHSPRSRGGSGGGRGTARRCGVGAPRMSRASPPGRPPNATSQRSARRRHGHAPATPWPRYGHRHHRRPKERHRSPPLHDRPQERRSSPPLQEEPSPARSARASPAQSRGARREARTFTRGESATHGRARRAPSLTGAQGRGLRHLPPLPGLLDHLRTLRLAEVPGAPAHGADPAGAQKPPGIFS